MSNILERRKRSGFVSENSPVKFVETEDEIATRRETRLEPNSKENVWYWIHRMEPDFHNQYDESVPPFNDGSKAQTNSNTCETSERIAVQRHYITGCLAMELEEDRWHMKSQTVESMCHSLNIFHNIGVFLPEATLHEGLDMQDRVEVATNTAITMAGFGHFDDYQYVNPELQERFRMFTDTNDKTCAFMKLVGLIARDLVAPEDERIVMPTKKRMTNTFTIRGMVVCDFPELWIDNWRKHDEIMKNIREIVTEAHIWTGADESTGKGIANASVINLIKNYER